jgi:hypothetical protein
MDTCLEQALKVGDPLEVQQSIFEIGRRRDAQGVIPDETAFYLIDVLRRPEMKASALAGHVLNFFEFEAPRLSPRAKDRCLAFLREWGNDFSDVHAMQVVTELLNGDYLTA